MRHTPNTVVDEALRAMTTVAVIGLSDRVDRPAWDISLYLQDAGISIVPVHPTAREVHGERVWRDVREIPPALAVDTALLFVRPEIGEPIVDAIIAAPGSIGTIWMQPGAVSHDAADRAERAGLRVVRGNCVKVAMILRMRAAGLDPGEGDLAEAEADDDDFDDDDEP